MTQLNQNLLVIYKKVYKNLIVIYKKVLCYFYNFEEKR